MLRRRVGPGTIIRVGTREERRPQRRALNAWRRASMLLLAIGMLAGCGATKSYIATEQLLLSDAIDETVDQIDFTPLKGRKVYLDTTYVSPVRSKTGLGLVSSEYIISSVREQMLLAGCHLCAEREKADLVAELRLGAMGTDGHSVMFGIPATNQFESAQPNGHSLLPSLPELSLAKRESMSGGAKIAVFAYERESRAAVWQSGLAQATSEATDTWIMGVGPMQQGSIHEHAQFAGQDVKPIGKHGSSVVDDQAKHRTPRSALLNNNNRATADVLR